MNEPEIKPRIDKIRLHFGSSAPTRKKPQHGDRRTTKKHGEQIRVFRMARWNGQVLGYAVSNGRQLYDWVAIEDAGKHGAWHHWTAEERAKYGTKKESIEK